MRREKRRKDSAFIDTLVTVVGSKNTIGLIIELVSTNVQKNATFVLYDVLGKEVARQVLLANGTSVKTEYLPSGIYLYQIINPQNQTLQHGKLSILH